MRLHRLVLLALSGSILVLAVASCGRYGKPVRSAPEPATTEQAPPERAEDVEKR